MGKGDGRRPRDALRRRSASARASPKFMAGRLFASSASPHRGPDSAVLSPKQRTPRHFSHFPFHLYLYLYGVVRPSGGLPSPVRVLPAPSRRRPSDMAMAVPRFKGSADPY